MIFKAKEKRRLTPGVHLVSIKDIYIARQGGENGMPLSYTDRNTGEEYGAIEIVFMNPENTGIREKFYLGSRQIWVLNNLIRAIGFMEGESIDKKRAVGCKLWIVVAKAYVYDNQIIRQDPSGELVWFPKLLPEFFPATQDRPILKGNPQDNNGKCGDEFIIHWDSHSGQFNPSPNYIGEDLQSERFGSNG